MRALVELTRVELRLFTREPLTLVFVLVLPLVILYVLNGAFSSELPDPTVWEGLPAVDFYASAYVALVAGTAGVLSVPVHLASYREQGVLRRFRASALPNATLLGAQALVAGLTALAGATLLGVVSVLAYDAPVPENWPGVLGAFLIVSAAFSALGLLLGLLMPTARAAQGLGVLLFFVFMMLGGAGPPREVLPETLRLVGDGVPMTYAARLLRDPWLGRGWDGVATVVMLGLLVACLAVTAWVLRRQDRA